MCGIVGYIGKQNAVSVGLDSIRELEYRGYDSSGTAFFDDETNSIRAFKAVGRIDNLAMKLNHAFSSKLAIFHTRWATHGMVSEANSHPHSDCYGSIWVCHNGIIENYKELKEKLMKSGHKFKSETDTEVISHLIEEERKKSSFEDSVRKSLAVVKGTYGLVILSAMDPGKLVAARNFSPLVLGVGDEEYFVASDASAVIKHTKQIIYFDDGDIAVITPNTHHIYDLSMNLREKKAETFEWSYEETQKNGYSHFMLKEIFEEPDAVENSLRGRLLIEEGSSNLGALSAVERKLKEAKRIIISGCGTAYLAGRVGEYMIEEYAGIPVKVDLASEFRYRKPVFRDGDVFISISQSGETADTLAALREVKKKNILTLGIVNAVGSSLARETDVGIYQHIRPRNRRCFN